jgi:glutamate/tyrosine decarboxylase-like PLP-dependent enzyme
MSQYDILNASTNYALEYLNTIRERRVFPSTESLELLKEFPTALVDEGINADEILRQLHAIASQTTVATNGGRYFGFVTGATLPASMAANWLASAWDQNAAFKVYSPLATYIEKLTSRWLLELLQLPSSSAVGFVTGTTMANFSGVVAARYHLSKQMGWDIKSKGMNGAPPIKVIVGAEVHASMQRALLLAGFGLDNLIKVPTDEQGRIIPDNFPEMDASTLVCLQAGNVNTGAIDPVKNICIAAKEKGGWVHIDGAFGLWARVSPNKIRMTEGCELADSWAVDLHKWLNVPYDSGVVICRQPEILQNALSVSATYLPNDAEPEPFLNTPEMSRRARAIDTWAAISSLGKNGVRDLIERCCSLATQFASNLKNAGFEILNDVVLNQVLVSFGDAETTNRIIKKVQEDGTCWCGGTIWNGKTAMRISVSSWMTMEEDIEVCSQAISRIARKELEPA